MNGTVVVKMQIDGNSIWFPTCRVDKVPGPKVRSVTSRLNGYGSRCATIGRWFCPLHVTIRPICSFFYPQPVVLWMNRRPFLPVASNQRLTSVRAFQEWTFPQIANSWRIVNRIWLSCTSFDSSLDALSKVLCIQLDLRKCLAVKWRKRSRILLNAT